MTSKAGNWFPGDYRIVPPRGNAGSSKAASGRACLVVWAKEGHLPLAEREAVIRGHIDKQRIFASFRIFKATNSIGKIVRSTEKGHYEAISQDELVAKLTKVLNIHVAGSRIAIESSLIDYWKQAGLYLDILSEQQTTTDEIRPDDDRQHSDRFDHQHDSYRLATVVMGGPT